MSNSTPLACQYDSRKSFYGKANVRSENGRVILTSYSTDVAYIEDGGLHVNGRYSATTDRHVREFMKQYGFMAAAQMPWAQVLDTYGPNKDTTRVCAACGLSPEAGAAYEDWHDSQNCHAASRPVSAAAVAEQDLTLFG